MKKKLASRTPRFSGDKKSIEKIGLMLKCQSFGCSCRLVYDVTPFFREALHITMDCVRLIAIKKQDEAINMLKMFSLD